MGGWIADNWSWRWIFYINLPIGVLGFLMVSAFLFDSPFVKKPRGIDAAGLVLMVFGFGFLQLALDLGEKEDWFDSGLIVGLFMLAVCSLVAFVVRELTAAEPILDLSVFNDRNFTVGTLCIAFIGLGFNSSMLLIALYTQKILAYDAWNSGLVLAPGGLGTMLALMISGRLVARMDQRVMLAGGLPAERLRHHAHDPAHARHGLLEPRLAALSPGLLHGLHLSTAADAHARHRLDWAASATPPPPTTWCATWEAASGSRSPRPSSSGAARSTRPRWSLT